MGRVANRQRAHPQHLRQARCRDRFFLGDYIAVESTNSKAQMLYTGNGPKAMDVLSIQAGI
jgi:hypothetical protein